MANGKKNVGGVEVLDARGLPVIDKEIPPHIPPEKREELGFLAEKLETVPNFMQEKEQGFLLSRHHESAGALEDKLRQLAETQKQEEQPAWQSVGTIRQAVISPDYIPKTRLRIVTNPEGGKLEAFVTLKGYNPNKNGNGDRLHPRFEIDLPIDMQKLEAMHASERTSQGNPWHATDTLNELLDFAGYGVVTKQRYKHKDADGRVYDFDFYDWKPEVLETIKNAAADAAEKIVRTSTVKKKDVESAVLNARTKAADAAESLYKDLALVDVEMTGDQLLTTIDDFPETIRPFVRPDPQDETKQKPFEITREKLFKGRRLTSYAGMAAEGKNKDERSGLTMIDAASCTEIKRLIESSSTLSK